MDAKKLVEMLKALAEAAGDGPEPDMGAMLLKSAELAGGGARELSETLLRVKKTEKLFLDTNPSPHKQLTGEQKRLALEILTGVREADTLFIRIPNQYRCGVVGEVMNNMWEKAATIEYHMEVHKEPNRDRSETLPQRG